MLSSHREQSGVPTKDAGEQSTRTAITAEECPVGKRRDLHSATAPSPTTNNSACDRPSFVMPPRRQQSCGGSATLPAPATCYRNSHTGVCG